MKKIKYKFLFILILVLGIFISGCQEEEENPGEVFDRYTSHWIEEDFTSMYDMLSGDSKDYISQEEFINRYENIYNGIGAKDIQITFNEEEEYDGEETPINIPYDFQMETIIGSMDFKHRAQLIEEEREEGNVWALEWDESMIFPQMEEGDSIRVSTIPADRGEIIDSNGMAIAQKGEIQAIGLVPYDLEIEEDADNIKEILAEEFQMSVEDIDEKLGATWVEPHHFVPIGSLSLDDEEKILELTALPAVQAQRESARVYPFKEAAAHLVGYTGSITSEELENRQGEGYNQNSIIGKTGLELLYEDRLRAIDGRIINIVDENNNVKESLGESEAQNGEDIQLTIDILLQENIYEEMDDEKGTAIAMNPKRGEVLALVNKPAYDPNQFILGLSRQQWEDLNDDPDLPLLNRFSQTYTPGSVFKPIVAAIGLENDLIDPNEALSISGLQWQKDSSWGNYRITRVTDPGGPVNLRDALVYSDNIYFGQAALEMGEDVFLQGAREFGFDEEIDFQYQVGSSKITNDGSFSGEIQLADSGYGQGQVQISPLHLTTMYTTFLNEGNMVKPHLLKEINEEPIYWKESVISSSVASRIRDNLIQVIEDSQGTGNPALIEGRVLGGKTGTTEFKDSQDEEGINNGSFIAFDSQDENIIIMMTLEDVAGSGVVIPKVRNIIENY